MNFKLITEKFYQLELDLNLFEKQIDDVYFWELVRWNIHREILQKKGLFKQKHNFVKHKKKYLINHILNAAKNSFVKNPFICSKADFLFLGHSRRKLLEDNFWWDIYTDPIIDALKYKNKCLLLERPIWDNHFTPSKTYNIKYLDIISILGSLLTLSKLNKIRYTNKDKLLLKEIEQKFEKRFEVTLRFEHLVLKKLNIRKNQIPFFRSLLKKIDPKIVFIVVSYVNEPFIEACKQTGKPTIEIQHGTSLGFYHPGYSFPIKYPKKIFPDYLFAFGDFWKYRMKYSIPKSRIFSVGYPFFEMEVNKFNDEPKKDQVVFISQETIGQQLSKFAVDLIKSKQFSIAIVYKLHPTEYKNWQKNYPWLVNSGIKVLDDDSFPLYRLLSQSKAMVGVYSTVLYEGLGLGVKTFLLDLPGIEYMNELIASGAVFKITSVEELIYKLKGPVVNKVCPEHFFKPDALKNINLALETILHEHSSFAKKPSQDSNK